MFISQGLIIRVMKSGSPRTQYFILSRTSSVTDTLMYQQLPCFNALMSAWSLYYGLYSCFVVSLIEFCLQHLLFSWKLYLCYYYLSLDNAYARYFLDYNFCFCFLYIILASYLHIVPSFFNYRCESHMS